MAKPTSIAPRAARQLTQSLRSQHKVVTDDDGTTTVTRPQKSATVSQLSRKLYARITFRHVSFAFVFVIVLALLISDPEQDPDGTARYRARKPDGYNLGYFLNLTAIVDPSQRVNQSKVLSFPDSLAARYLALPVQRCTQRPLRQHIQQLFSTADHIPKTFSDLNYLRLVQRPDTLTVQLCIGHKHCGYSSYRLRIDLDNSGRRVRIDDDQSDNTFLRRVARYALAGNYTTVLLVPTLGDSQTYLVKRTLKKLRHIARAKRFRLSVREALPGWAAFDNRILILSRAHNLVVHRGVEAALIALASSAPQGVLMSEAFRTFLSSDELKYAIHLRRDGIKLSGAQIAMNGMGTVEESCCTMLPLGQGDSTKVVCRNVMEHALLGNSRQQALQNYQNDTSRNAAVAALQKRHKCWVLSLGCGNKWSFEQDVIDMTSCSVHVFDCTKKFKVPSNLQHRVKWSKICVGPTSNPAKGMRTWKEIIDIGSEAAGLPIGTVPEIGKVDVEGWEFPVFNSLVKDPAPILPKQLLVEIHTIVMRDIGHPFQRHMYGNRNYGTDSNGVKELFDGLFRVGYKLVHRVDNPHCPFCAEVTLLQSSAFPPVE